jgi:hypothetical protein
MERLAGRARKQKAGLMCPAFREAIAMGAEESIYRSRQDFAVLGG